MVRITRLLIAASLMLITMCSTVNAQPTPRLTVPGVMNTGTLGTFFFCTNPSEAPVAIAVQVLALDGTPINVWSDTSALLGPHTTEVWATDVADGLSVDQFQNMGIGMLNYGSAQILATSARIACSAFIADRYSNPPASMTTLSMVKGKQQKGD